MATIVEMINPLTGLPEQVDKLDHTAQEIDDAVTRAFKVSARNFLRNWYFVNPVNQRGVSGTISTTGYFIDGWKLVSGTVQITSTGLVLNGTIEQILESGIGQLVKATFLASDGVFDASYNDSTKTFTITATGKTLIAAKLELGSQQTLAHQDADGNLVLNEIPDYGEQLARCQRYFIRIGVPAASENSAIGFANCANATLANSHISTPVTMRAIPTATIKNIVLRKGITDFNVTACNIFATTGNGIYMNFVSSGLTVGDTLLIRTVTGGYIDFTADL